MIQFKDDPSDHGKQMRGNVKKDLVYKHFKEAKKGTISDRKVVLWSHY